MKVYFLRHFFELIFVLSLLVFILPPVAKADSTCISNPTGCVCTSGPTCYTAVTTYKCSLSNGSCGGSGSTCPLFFLGDSCQPASTQYNPNGTACQGRSVFECAINTSYNCLGPTGNHQIGQCDAVRTGGGGGGSCTLADGQCVSGSCCITGVSHLDSSCASGSRCGPGAGSGGGGGGGNGACGSCNSCGSPLGAAGCALINGVCSKAGYCGGGGPSNSCTIKPAQSNITLNVGDTTPLTFKWSTSNTDHSSFANWYFAGGSPVLSAIPRTQNECCVYSTGNFSLTGGAVALSTGTEVIQAWVQQSGSGSHPQCFSPVGCATVTCTANITVTVVGPPPAWFQANGGDAISNGVISASIPAGQNFSTNGLTGVPGNVLYAGSTTLTKSNVSAKGWLGNLAYNGKTYNSSYFVNNLPTNIITNNLSSTASQADFDSGNTSSDGYTYFLVNSGSLNLVGNLIVTGNKKIVLIVKGGDFNVNGNISIQTLGSGFFMSIVSGNTTINPAVTTLQGIFESDGNFSSGSGNAQLTVNGTVVAWGNMQLGRDLSGSNSTNAGEVFNYDPTLTLLFPRNLLSNPLSWKELTP